jgi:hypothetical protein
MCESGISSFVYTTVQSENTLPGRWVAMLLGRWVAKLVAHLLATAALWVRIQTSIKHTNWAPLAKERQTHSSPPKKIYKKRIHNHTLTPLKQKVLYNEEVSSGRLRFSLSKLYTTVCLFVCPAPRCIPAHTADAPLLRVNRSRTHAPQLITRSWSNGRPEGGWKERRERGGGDN